MTGHLSAQIIEGYRRRALSPAELIAADDHFAVCESCCAQRQASAPANLAAIAVAADWFGAPEHLQYEQLAAYVDRELSGVEREVVESHLSHCESCLEQCEELRAFAARLSTYPDKEYAPAVVPSLWERISRLLDIGMLAGLAPALRIAGAMALVLLIALPAFFIWRGLSSRETTNEVASDPASVPTTAVTPPRKAASPQPSVEEKPLPAPVQLALNDGGKQIALDAQGRLVGGDELSAADRQRVLSALKSKSIPVAASVEFGSTRGTLMGGPTERTFNLLTPISKIVTSERPVLRWQKLAGAESYRVEISDPAENYKEVATSPALTTNEWKVDVPLERGRVYTWQVVALKSGEEIKAPSPDAPEAKFKVLEQSRLSEIERAKRKYAGQHLILGLLYADAGLLDEAERELQALVAANPDSAAARSLLRSLQVRRSSR